MPQIKTAVVYPAQAGSGGLGLQALTAVAGLALAGPVTALGPGRSRVWVLETPCPEGITWEEAPVDRPSWFSSKVVRRLRPGRIVFSHDRQLGRWGASQLDRVRPTMLYAFVQVGLESLEWARRHGVPSVLDNPNGHIRGFARAYREESAKWFGKPYHGHPTAEMVARVEREYELADRIRVSSEWARQSMVREGVPASKIFVCPQPLNRTRFAPPAERPPAEGPLRVVYVGMLDLRKGFVYLLKAGQLAGPHRVSFTFVGGTGDRQSKTLLAREGAGLNLTCSPGDPVPPYHRAELFALPTLEDGFGFVAAEAMACGLPVVVTDQCGVAEWVRPGETGWIVPAGDANALAGVFDDAISRRFALAEMGRNARLSVEARDPAAALHSLAEAVHGRTA